MERNRHSQFTVLGKPFLSIGAQVHNSSGYRPEGGMEDSYRAAAAVGANTIAVPVCWDAFEPIEGSFDEGYVRTLIDLARGHGMHLVLLWFGTWKNGQMEYTPTWVKQDRIRFPRVECRDGTATTVLTPHCERNRRQDELAFCRLLEIVKAYDECVGTVIAVQVENEPGYYAPTRRDFSDFAQPEFEKNVPRELLEALRTTEKGTRLYEIWLSCGGRDNGNWIEVFGRYGAEAFTAWAIASYIDRIAEAGRRIYDIFLYTNVWTDCEGSLGWDIGGLDYPCGGAVAKALPIWRTAAGNLDAICPDLYDEDLLMLACAQDSYAERSRDWPLYVPESGLTTANATMMFRAIGKRGAIGFHVFGIESCFDENGELTRGALAIRRSMQMLQEASPLIVNYRDSGRMYAFWQVPGASGTCVELGNWKCRISYNCGGMNYGGWLPTDYRHRVESERQNRFVGSVREESARGLLFWTGENEFYLVGHGLRLYYNRPEPLDGSLPAQLMSYAHQSHGMETLVVEEGHFEGERYVSDRIRSGDEARHGIWAQADCGVVHVVLGNL